jgi:MraZ protein
MGLFWGEFSYKMDEKGRLPLPYELATELLEGKVYISISPDGCLILFPARTWTKMKKDTGRFFQPEEVHIKKHSSSWEVLIPKNLRRYLSKEVTVAGCKNYIELWGKEKWSVAKREAEKEIAALFV